MTRLLLALLAFYKRWLSPAVHTLGVGGCKFMPTCSEYAATAIAVHGSLRGSALTCWRLLRCHPFTPGGFDPVPTTPGSKDRFPGDPVPLPELARDVAARRGEGPSPHEPLP